MFDEKENFEGEKNIAEMLSNLKRVEAPTDFDTRVRARIASGRVSEGATAWTANLIRIGAFAAVAVVVVFGGYFVLTSINTGQNDVPSIAQTRSEPQNPIVGQPSSNTETSQSTNRATTKPSDDLVADNVNPATTNNNAKPNGPNSTDSDTTKDRSGDGSMDIGLGVDNKINPRGLNPNAKIPANAKGVDPNARIHVSQILDFIGVKATWAGDGWRVDSLAANNIAERSGIKTGDVVEAINGQTVDKKTTLPAKFDGKSVRVRRDGVSLLIDFKP